MKQFLFSSLRRLSRVLPRGIFAASLSALAYLTSIHPALAAGVVDATTFGDMICNSAFGIGNYNSINVCNVVAYCAGAGFIGQGIHMLVRYYDNPSGMRLSEPLTRIGGGSALMAPPQIARAIIMTLYGQNLGGGLTSCTATGTKATANGIGLDTLLTNLMQNIETPFNLCIATAAFVIGSFMVVRGLLKASKYGSDPRENSMPKILSNMIVGAVLMVTGQNFEVLVQSLFGTGTVKADTDVKGWTFVTSLNASTQFTDAIMYAGDFFVLVGMVAFVRGWMIIKGAAEGSGQATIAQGITHVVGGVLAMNIFGFLEIMDTTFGTNFIS